MASNVDQDEVAHEPPHQDLHYLQIQLFLSLVHMELRKILRQTVWARIRLFVQEQSYLDPQYLPFQNCTVTWKKFISSPDKKGLQV